MNKIIEKFKEKTKGQNLFTFHGPFSPLLTGVPWTNSKESPATPSMPLLFVSMARDTQVVISDDSYKGHAKEVFEKYLKDQIEISHLKDLFDKTFTEARDLYERVFSSDIKQWGDSEIELTMDKACIYLWNLIARTLYMETFDRQIADSVVPEKYKKALEKIWEKSTHPVFESFEIRRKKQTVEIVRGYGISDEAARKATFIYTDYFLPKKVEEIKENLALCDVNQPVNFTSDDRKIYESWLGSLSQDERKLAEYIQFVMEMRDIRKDPIAWIQAVLAETAFEMARRAGIDKDIVPTISPLEYRGGIDWLKNNKEQLLLGKSGSVLFIQDNGEIEREFTSPESVKSDIDELLNLPKDISEIKGQPASKGNCRGVVRIVIDPEGQEAKDFENGNILVTSMTRPEFVPLMRKAGAIVTNEGGITCHAAIISRELKKPCIIGTKIATKVLKDGDRVEVDADKGVVRILKRV